MKAEFDNICPCGKTIKTGEACGVWQDDDTGEKYVLCLECAGKVGRVVAGPPEIDLSGVSVTYDPHGATPSESRPVTPERLAEIEALVSAVAVAEAELGAELPASAEESRRFMASAWDDVPDLCAEVWRAWNENDAERNRRGEAEAENEKLREQLAAARAREATPEKVEAARRDVMDLLMFHFPPAQMTGLWPKVEAAIAKAFGLEMEAPE